MTEPVMAIGAWKNNAELIHDVARLGYLDGNVLDPTYGKGGFWKLWRPEVLVACDLDEDKSPIGHSVNFCDLPFPDRHFFSVVFDPPYKLNGTPDEKVDERYGVHRTVDWRSRMSLIREGAISCSHKADRFLLVKCQDQVCSGKVRWQTTMVIDAVTGVPADTDPPWRLRDRFDMMSYRAQPPGRSQKHARRNASTLLVFERNY